MADINKLLVEASAKVGTIGKNAFNAQQNFAFRGIDAVIAAVHPVFAELGINIVPEVLEHHSDEREVVRGNGKAGVDRHVVIRVKYIFFAVSDGSSVEAITVGEAVDSGDKASNKAMSSALKYALTQLLLTPTQDMVDDADSYTPELAKKVPQPARRQPEAKQAEPTRPPTKVELIARDVVALAKSLDADQQATFKGWIAEHLGGKKIVNMSEPELLQCKEQIAKIQAMPSVIAEAFPGAEVL